MEGNAATGIAAGSLVNAYVHAWLYMSLPERPACHDMVSRLAHRVDMMWSHVKCGDRTSGMA